MIGRQHVVEDFFQEGEAMRATLDASFQNASAATIRWQYLYDQRLYTILRADPRSVFPEALFESFSQRLRMWCLDSMGLLPAAHSNVNLMVDGCKLGLHTDRFTGAWAYVYSLTRWQTRRFAGGETLLLDDGVPNYRGCQVHGDLLYKLIPARFNQLLTFDDRIVHGTTAIEGNMDPTDGRVAVVGHFRPTSPVVNGSIKQSTARKVIHEWLPSLNEEIKAYNDVQGLLTYRLEIAPNGTLASATKLTDNLVSPARGYSSESVHAVQTTIERAVYALRFPADSVKSTVTVAILVPIPNLQPIECAVRHFHSSEQVIARLVSSLGKGACPDLQGTWDGTRFVASEPFAGYVRVEPRRITVSFDPPMWMPAQRERFEMALVEWIKNVAST